MVLGKPPCLVKICLFEESLDFEGIFLLSKFDEIPLVFCVSHNDKYVICANANKLNSVERLMVGKVQVQRIENLHSEFVPTAVLLFLLDCQNDYIVVSEVF